MQNHARDLCMLFASYDPTVYPNPRFMKWQEQPPWHVIYTPLQPSGASPVLLTGHELSVFCNEQSKWGIFRMLCRMPQSWSQRLRLDCWLRLSCGLITFFDHYSLQYEGIRRPGLRPRPHNFVLHDKDDCNFIPRILYCTLLQ